MKQIKKTKIVKDLVKARNSETDLILSFKEEIKKMVKTAKKWAGKVDREPFNEFISQIALIDIYIDQFRVRYGTEIESVKVTHLEKFKREMEGPPDFL